MKSEEEEKYVRLLAKMQKAMDALLEKISITKIILGFLDTDMYAAIGREEYEEAEAIRKEMAKRKLEMKEDIDKAKNALDGTLRYHKGFKEKYLDEDGQLIIPDVSAERLIEIAIKAAKRRGDI